MMVYYLLLAYYIQCFRAYHASNKCNNDKLETMTSFNDVMDSLTGYPDYYTVDAIVELTSRTI